MATITNIALVLVTTALAVFTAGLWWATYQLAKDAKETSTRQAEEMRRSLEIADKTAVAAEDSNRVTRDAFIASERPWISVEAIVNKDFVRKDHGIEFGVLFTLTNHGRSPAVNAHVLYKVLTLKSPLTDQFEGDRRELEELATLTGQGNFMGIQIFPSDQKLIPWQSPLTNKEMEKALEFYTPREGFLPSFYVVGSAFYQSPFGDDWYQTGFSYYVMDVGNIQHPHGSDLPNFSDIFPQGRVVLQPQSFNKGTIS